VSHRRARLARFRAEHPARELEVGGVRWSYLVGGPPEAGTTVLYLPGGMGQAEAAFGYLLDIERDHRVISVTYPGVASMTGLVDGVVAVLAAAEGTGATRSRPLDVWGTSFGGMVAQCLVRRIPGQVRTLILSNTAAPSPQRAVKARQQRRVVSVLPGFLVRPLMRVALQRQLGGLDPDDRAFWREYLDAHLATAKQRVTMLSAASEDFYRTGFGPDDLAGWPGRVLILQAEDDELYASMHEPLSRLYPNATVHTFAGGHAASVGREADYVAAVREFLRSAAD